ncbi:MAG: MptD family putative ECF transporter S component [Propionibacterium sp.]|nr:MptD family putative ECF transporter S component [Propionibacterium sp.]
MKTMTGAQQSGLTARDLVITGIFTALHLVFMMAGGGFFAPNPVLTFLMPAGAALLTGPVYLLLIAKVPKHGPVMVLGAIEAIVIFVTGMYWLWAVALFALGIVADLIAGAGDFRNRGLNLLSFVVFSLNPLGSYLMLWITPAAYSEYLTGRGSSQDYMATMTATGTGWVLAGMIILNVVCALISGMAGLKLLRKQFEKAGVTA